MFVTRVVDRFRQAFPAVDMTRDTALVLMKSMIAGSVAWTCDAHFFPRHLRHVRRVRRDAADASHHLGIGGEGPPLHGRRSRRDRGGRRGRAARGGPARGCSPPSSWP